MKFFVPFLLFALFLGACSLPHPGENIEAPKTTEPMKIDGKASEAVWQKSPWLPLDRRWLGEPYSPDDFQGQYKLAWNEQHLFLLVEITDDTLIDIHPDSLKLWWDDDCVEIFIDEDHSGGEHQYNHNAFAYHVALNYNVVDMAPGEKPRLYNDHISAHRTCKGKTCLWEFAISVFDDSFTDESPQNKPVGLHSGKVMGFALAYCDNDTSAERENFIGSLPVQGNDKNRGWIDAGIFGKLTLKE